MVKGLADSVPWTEETERQFKVAEEAVCGVARVYSDHGFDVLIDHCRNLPRLQQVADSHLEGLPVAKIALAPSLEENLNRNRTRTNKDFDPLVLDPIIEDMQSKIRLNVPEGWLVLDNTGLTPKETAERVKQFAESKMQPRG